MKQPMRLFLLAVAVLAVGISLSSAQAPAPAVGDYGAIATGLWSDFTNVWRAYSFSGGAFDSAVTAYPSSSKNVYILTGKTVTYDVSSQNCRNLIVQSGATLQSNQTLPTLAAIKVNGPLLWIDGTLGSATDGFSIETKYNSGPITVAGSGSINFGQIRPNSAQAEPLQLVFAANININYVGAGLQLTNRGAQTHVSITVNSGDTVNFAAGSDVRMASGATGIGNMNVTLNVNGVLNLPSSSLIIADSATYADSLNIGATGTVNVGKNFTPYLSGSGDATVRIAGGGQLNILSGGTADFSHATATVGGGGTFGLKAGATIKIGATSGLDASSGPVQTTTAALDSGASFVYLPTAGRSLGGRLPTVINNLTIDTTCVDTLLTSVRVKGYLYVNGSLTVKAGVLTIDTANVYGTLLVIGNGTADFSYPASILTGVGAFTVNKGGTINIGTSVGLDPATGPVRATTFTIDSTSSFGYTGTGYQQFGSMLPDSVYNLTIGRSSIDSITATRVILGRLYLDGLLVNSDSLVTVDTAIVNGTYQLNTVKQGLPIGKWKTGSLCLITVPVTTATGGIANGNQNFYNYEVNSPTHSGAGRLGFDGNTISGNLIIHNTNDPTTAGSNYVALFTKTGTTPVTLMGNLLIDSTAGSMSIGTGSGVAIQTLIVRGNVLNRGSLYLNGSGVTNKVYIYGDLTCTNPSTQSLRGHSATAYADTIFFAGTSLQKFVKVTNLTNMTNLSFRVLKGATLSLNDTCIVSLSGIGTFTVDSAATLKVANKGGVNGNITGVAPTLSTGANYEFNGDTAQVTGTWFPASVRKLTLSDSLGLTLSNSLTVTSSLVLGGNKLSTTDTNTVILPIGSSLSRVSGYVIGNLRKQYASAGTKNYEVGTANGYSPVNVNVLVGSGAMTVKAVQGQHAHTFDATKTLARYWTLTADAGITKANLKFAYLAGDVNGTESKYGAWRYSGTGTTWTALPSVNQVALHIVSVDSVTSFSDWTLGESSLSTDVSTSPESTIPTVFFVNQNYPNPFNPTTTISYGLPHSGYVSVKVFNVLGQEVATVAAGEQSAGIHTLLFDASRLSSGVYFYRIQAGTSVEVKRMVLLK